MAPKDAEALRAMCKTASKQGDHMIQVRTRDVLDLLDHMTVLEAGELRRQIVTLGKALELAEAQIAEALALDAESIVDERSTAADAQRLYAIQCTEVALSYVRRIFRGSSTEFLAPTFDLTPGEATRTQSWYYSAADDFIADEQDRDLARRIGNFIHAHGLKQ